MAQPRKIQSFIRFLVALLPGPETSKLVNIMGLCEAQKVIKGNLPSYEEIRSRKLENRIPQTVQVAR